MEVVSAFGAMVLLGTVLALPDLQQIIEQQRSQAARECEYVRRCRVEIEA